MADSPKRSMFMAYRKRLSDAGLSTADDDALICPLCWRETPNQDLTLEHIVPGSVGGAAKVLTCRPCNNNQGSSLDAHLAQYQKINDAFRGHGTLPTEMKVNGKRLVANLEWREDTKNFIVVGKASDPREQEEVRSDFQQGKVSEFKVDFDFGYSRNGFQTAALRAGYLVLFKCFGYEFAKHDVVQIVRKRICDPTLEHPQLKSLILGVQGQNLPDDEPHLVAHGNVNGVEFFLVILRVKRQTANHLGVFLPVPTYGCEKFFDLMEECYRQREQIRFTIPTTGLFK